VVARGARLAWLEREQAVVLGSGERAAVTVRSALDEQWAWDLVLVTVLATQVDAVLPSLRVSAAHAVMFMFNTFESLEPLRQAVGPERFAFGFPGGVFALMKDGRVQPQIRSGTTASDAKWAALFTEAGIPCVVEDDMQSWLRTHAAMVAPLMAIGTIVHARGSGVSWQEASVHATAVEAGVRIVQAAGNELRPASVRTLLTLPHGILTATLWALSRTKTLRDLGALGATEPRMLIDMMQASAADLAAPLSAIRP
jgi:2-dehydropantoate 2-reductase